MPASQRPVLLLTRPEPDSQRFAAMLPEWRAVIAPVLRIVPVAHDADALHRAAGLVFTSAHAVASAGPGRGRLAICVGARTADIAQAAGFRVQVGNGFADSLPPLIDAAGCALIHPHGRHLAKDLGVPGVVVYDQQAQALTPQARGVLAGNAPVVVPVFSPRSARLVADALRDARAPIWLVAISAAADRACDVTVARRIVAAVPTVDAMRDGVLQSLQPEQS
ncbi:uroporphyrinogen-III synthase [Paracoccus sp. (in: a-proteobacteria)]|uniref:uroporphyrinogen-III synthase n=1 Tax=Paracoccus sp. TaxID=267 RepID=UPI0026DEF33C|nr:uroporphyrinogen-III synthase [Paracoccus sp. (in: a-proteobacteria)]MDO5647216.1 uroporphyrinogen-III synthase [Paracoccus sp. (in: a-proteobacteria)]